MTDITATAIVTVTLEIKAEGCWADDTSMRQIHKQARESAIQILNGAFKENTHAAKIKVIDTPNITSVITNYNR